MKSNDEQYFPVAPFIMLCKVVLRFAFVDEIFIFLQYLSDVLFI